MQKRLSSRPVLLNLHSLNFSRYLYELVISYFLLQKSFAYFIKTMAREHKGKLALDSLLIMPVQRIPRYELLIKVYSLFNKLIRLHLELLKFGQLHRCYWSTRRGIIRITDCCWKHKERFTSSLLRLTASKERHTELSSSRRHSEN